MTSILDAMAEWSPAHWVGTTTMAISLTRNGILVLDLVGVAALIGICVCAIILTARMP